MLEIKMEVQCAWVLWAFIEEVCSCYCPFDTRSGNGLRVLSNTTLTYRMISLAMLKGTFIFSDLRMEIVILCSED